MNAQAKLHPPKMASALALAALGICLVGIAPSASANNGKGFTFGKYSHDPVLGVDHVGIFGTGNPYTGDTFCTARRPILCLKHDGSARPPYPVAPGNEFYQGWAEGHLATTKPVRGNTLLSAADGDAQCVANFGAGWRMAEFHDGKFMNGMDAGTHYYSTPYSVSPWLTGSTSPGGHTLWGFGNVRSDMRYWVHINDQPGNCWD